jgi:hypothetical protein
MTDWREIVDLIQNFASVYQARNSNQDRFTRLPALPTRSNTHQPLQNGDTNAMDVEERHGRPPTPPTPNALPSDADAKFNAPPDVDLGMKQWHSMSSDNYFERRWWFA